jgi:hypothetical protein
MLPMLSAIAPLAKILFSTIEKSVPDKDLQEKLKAQLNHTVITIKYRRIKSSSIYRRS